MVELNHAIHKGEESAKSAINRSAGVVKMTRIGTFDSRVSNFSHYLMRIELYAETRSARKRQKQYQS